MYLDGYQQKTISNSFKLFESYFISIIKNEILQVMKLDEMQLREYESITDFAMKNNILSIRFEKLIDEILESNIDCLVVDYHLSDAGVQFEGSNIIEEIHKIRPFFPKIIYTAKEDKVIPVEFEVRYFLIY